jgi:hypothetical protein
MEEINCLNFCEILNIVYEQDSTYDIVFDKIMTAKGLEYCQRIYFGSSFCSQYFLHLRNDEIDSLINICNKRNMNLTLVIPTFTGKDLEKGKKKINSFSHYFNHIIDEITVNDYGMLKYIRDTYEIKINMGRLFMKDYRDPRHEDYFMRVYKPKIFTEYNNSIVKEYGVSGFEFDLTHEVVDFSNKPENIQIGVHYPYSYMTVGHICELASIGKDISKKYRPNAGCNKECHNNRIKYEFEDGREWFKYGRTIYFNNSDCTIKGNLKLRKIFFPISEVLQ